MQDIVFYAAANETLGIVRDYANVRNQSAPVLTLGVSVCLRIRLFASTEGAASYPITSFNGITSWKWRMDGDYDRSTACKLIADESSISVHTVSDTVNGETQSFTEFAIPISNMNTQELTAWLGTEKMRSGLTGELVGYDSSENAAFVLQIENFSVRNRVAGLNDPTALDEENVTRTQAERMIQTAVSSSAATKQDKLTSANGGTGISVSSTGVISVSDIPRSSVSGLTASLTGLSASLAAKQNTLTAGYRMAIVSGSTVEQSRYFAIEPAVTAPANQTTTVVLSAGKAYEIHAVATNAKVLLNREEPVGGTHTFALEGHAEIFVANTGYIQTGTNVVLSQPLEPDAINYCTVRFRRGLAVISVEDHIGGCIVVDGGAVGSGTLNYGLASAGSQYIAFNDTLAGLTIDMGGAVTNGEKHVVGNGYSDTILTGGVSCTSKTTFANLSMRGVAVTGGTMTLGDVYIPNGATVSMSGGGLAVEKVTGNGGTIDLGGTNVVLSSGTTASASGCTFSGGKTSAAGGAFDVRGSLNLQNVKIENNEAQNGGAIAGHAGANINISSCFISGNVATQATARCNGLFLESTQTTTLTDCTFAAGQDIRYADGSTKLVLTGSNVLLCSAFGNGSVTISSGAIVDLTGNTNTTPIKPGGGVKFEQGGATVYPSAGSASAFVLGGMTVPQLGNTNVVNLGGAAATVASNCTASGVTFTSGNPDIGGIIPSFEGNGDFYSCVFNNPTGSRAIVVRTGSALLSNCTLIAGGASLAVMFTNSGAVTFAGDCTISGRVSGTAGSVTISSGASINLTSSIAPGGGIMIPAGAVVTIIGSGGSSAYLSELALTGSTITNAPAVLGATVTIPASGGPWDVDYADRTSEVFSASETERTEVLSGAVVYIGGQ